MKDREAIEYFQEEIMLCEKAPSINGCAMTEDWKRTIEACKIAISAIKQLHEAKSELAAMRNELCCKSGKYREAHNGACNGCRWKEAQ